MKEFLSFYSTLFGCSYGSFFPFSLCYSSQNSFRFFPVFCPHTALLLKHCTFVTRSSRYDVMQLNYKTLKNKQRDNIFASRGIRTRNIIVRGHKHEWLLASGILYQPHAHTRRVFKLCKIQSPSRDNNYNSQTFTSRTLIRT